MKYFNPFSLLLFICVTFSPIAFAQEKEIQIKLIEVKGNDKIDRTTIRSRLSLQEGDFFSPEAVKNDVDRIYRLGFFDHVEVESEGLEGGIALFFIVHEKPFLIDVVYEGNENIAKEQLEEKVPIRTETFIDAEAIRSYVRKLKGIYESEAYYNARVTPVTQVLANNQAVLTFLIEEGEQAYIRKIRFEGNKAFKDKVLKKGMESSTYFWLTSWLTESGRYKKEALEADVERVRAYYANHGYLQIQVDAPQVVLSDDNEWFDIVIPVIEGEQFTVGGIQYEGSTILEKKALIEKTVTKKGEIFNRGQLRRDIMGIVDLFGEKGYIYANVVPQLNARQGEDIVDIVFRVSEGDRAKVREIHISGNTKTRDKVIRREIRVNEQEMVNTKLLRRSFQRLQNLNFFENVEIVPKQIEPGWVDLDVTVKEKPTGTFSIGGGYSSVDRFIATMDVTLGNFLGKGQLLRVKVDTGKRRTTYRLTFREPYLFDRNLSGTVDLFNQERSFGTYREKRIGGNLILGRSFGEYVRSSVSYTAEELQVSDLQLLSDGTIDPIVPLQVQEQALLGKTLTSAVGFSLTRDTRDFAFDPKSGSRNSVTVEYAGTFLGGDNAYLKIIGDSSRFFPLWWNHIFSLHGRIGYASGIEDKVLPVGERFFTGGINTVRGFKFGKAGPTVPGTGEVLGGNKVLFFNVEYLVPIVKEAQIKALLFYDYGAAFDDDELIHSSGMRKAAGFGIRWISPVGPLRLEWGWNLSPRPDEPTRTVEFSIGTLF
ncbi:MAG: outer membrane protein assembly factor BamA [Nitrospira sp.]|nr:outer membrane protein assembly factor BamA [Candidatus Manganitrophaceae bacterium]HIL35549.1 outer membrane protein assembly factor BamA [Candidatus Manganitrophaceae bacterium]